MISSLQFHNENMEREEKKSVDKENHGPCETFHVNFPFILIFR